MHLLLMILLVWLLFNLAVVFALSTRRPTPRRQLPDYLRRAL
jgi:hypothetical protein